MVKFVVNSPYLQSVISGPEVKFFCRTVTWQVFQGTGTFSSVLMDQRFSLQVSWGSPGFFMFTGQWIRCPQWLQAIVTVRIKTADSAWTIQPVGMGINRPVLRLCALQQHPKFVMQMDNPAGQHPGAANRPYRLTTADPFPCTHPQIVQVHIPAL